MIRRLDSACWYFDCDPGEEPHFATAAKALAHEAAAAAGDERDPRPVLRHTEPCWIGECDRCGCPFDDEDTGFTPLHVGSVEELATMLRAADWMLRANQHVSCPDCAAAPPPGETVTVTLAGHPSREVVAETTACAQLVIAPLHDEHDRWRGLALIHQPTGRHLPTLTPEPLPVLFRVAELLAGLDWSVADPAHYATGYPAHLLAAVEQAGREDADRAALPSWGGGGPR